MALPKAFVLNMYYSGIGIARNLGKYGIPVVGISSQSDAPGNFSRYCCCLIGPDSQNEPEKLLKFLIELGQAQNKKGILFPTRDSDILFIDRYRDSLGPFFEIPQPLHDVLDLIMNKVRLASVAESLMIRTPLTLRISSLEELNRKRCDMVFPAVVKPVYAYQWQVSRLWDTENIKKGIRVNTFKELLDIYRRISPHNSEILLQEWIPGHENQYFVLGAYFDRESECQGDFTLQKIIQYPANIGLGCLVRSVQNEEVRSLGLKFLKSINYIGIAEVEFKRDCRSGDYLLIEVNPRHWDQHTIGTSLGVNLTYLAYLDYCGNLSPLPTIRPPKKSHYWVSGGALIGSIKEDIKERKCELFKILALLPLRRKVYAVWDWKDQLPFWKTVVSKENIRKIYKVVAKKFRLRRC